MLRVSQVVWAALLLSLCKPTHAHLGSCEDHTPQCRGYAKAGYCNTQREFMLLNCPVSCNACLDPECYDRSHRCSMLAARGNCQTQPIYMLNVCPHSCDNCRLGGAASRPPVVRQRSIATPTFDCGRSQPSTTSTTTNTRGTRSEDHLSAIVNMRVARQIIFPNETGWESLVPLSDGRTKTKPPSRPLLDPIKVIPLTFPGKPTQPNEKIIMIPGKVDIMTEVSINTLQVGDTFCGATPISDRYLLTAAHCVLHPDKPVVTVRLGELDFAIDNEENSKPVDYEVSQIIVHPDYKFKTLERYNDVALIQTKKTIAFNEFVYPYCLSADRPAPKTLVTGAGFGLINGTTRSSRLQEAELELMDIAMCENIYRKGNQETQLRTRYPQLLQNRDIICAAYPERDACQGDSGGPLFLDRDGRRYLVGVVGSGGVSCRGNGVSTLPGLYASVADHIDFIDSVLYGLP